MKPSIPPKLGMFFIIALLVGPLAMSSQNFNSQVEGIITSNPQGELLQINGIAKNKTEGIFSLRYEFSVITSNAGNNNTSKNQQSGRFTLEPFGTKTLNESVLSIDSLSRTIILLVIYDQDDKVVGTDRLVLNDSKEDEKQLSYEKPNEGIQLIGMVTDRTKTKPGKDFYGYFFQKYNLSSLKRNEIIEINEIISFGRTTRISIKIGNDVIYRFLAKPNLQYLQDQADEAIRQLNRYFQYLDNRSEITQY